MTGMIKDIRLSEETLESFKSSLADSSLSGLDFKLEILTSGTWPQMNDVSCILPLEMKQCTEKFAMWYKTSNSNRQLSWLFMNGSVDL